MVKIVTIGSLLTRKRNIAKNLGEEVPVYAVTNDKGFALSSDLHDFTIHSDDTSNYLVVEKNDFAYNPSRLNIGSIAIFDKNGKGLISPMYVVFHADEQKILPKYLFIVIKSEAIKNKIDSLKEIGARFRFDYERWNLIEIPIPSLSEQQRIVTILGTFTSAIDNLKDQIAFRRKQYEFYRDQLLNLEGNEGVTFTTVGNACRTLTPPIKYGKKFYSRKGSFPIIDQGQTKIVGYTNEEKDVLPSDEYVLFGDHTRIVKYYNGRFAQGADGLKILKANKGILPKFLFFAFDSVKIPNKGYSRHWSFAKELQIPIPFLSDQRRIVSILDTFEASIANLEAQLKEREKQYEYYRNKLLTFE